MSISLLMREFESAMKSRRELRAAYTADMSRDDRLELRRFEQENEAVIRAALDGFEKLLKHEPERYDNRARFFLIGILHEYRGFDLHGPHCNCHSEYDEHYEGCPMLAERERLEAENEAELAEDGE